MSETSLPSQHLSVWPHAIEIQHLTKKYGTTTAVEDLCLNVPTGRLFGFLGPNGAGKTTTIGCLGGMLEPTSGRIRLLGRRFACDTVEMKRRIGVMPEGLALFDQLTAPEFLAFNARMYGLDESTTRRRVEELLDALGLSVCPRMPLAEFSGGMRKKVCFAASVIHRPEILFLDEPFAGIDPAATAMLKGWLRGFALEDRTVFLTTHVLETVERLCTDVAILKDGRLVWQGPIHNLESGGTVAYDGRLFRTLEELFLHLAGERHEKPDWI